MIYRVNFLSHKGTLQVVNTFHVEAGEDPWPVFGPSAPTPLELADEINTHLQALYLNVLATSYTWDSIDVVTVPDPTDPGQVPSGGSMTVGYPGNRTVADEDLPPRICGMIAWQTEYIGRSFRGRTFLPPLEKRVAISADLIAAADGYVTAAEAFADKVVDANLSSGSSWSNMFRDDWHGRFVVYSPTRHAAHAEPWANEITGHRISRKLAYLSSRDK